MKKKKIWHALIYFDRSQATFDEGEAFFKIQNKVTKNLIETFSFSIY